MKKLFIGKLSLSTNESSLRALFSEYEPIHSIRIMTNKFSGESRGFAFMEIDSDERASDAINAMNGAMLDGQTIVVNEARAEVQGSRSFGSRDSYRSTGNSYRSSQNSRY